MVEFIAENFLLRRGSKERKLISDVIRALRKTPREKIGFVPEDALKRRQPQDRNE